MWVMAIFALIQVQSTYILQYMVKSYRCKYFQHTLLHIFHPCIAQGENHALRRAYHEGCLLKAVDCLLVSMRRERQDGTLQLFSTSWDVNKTRGFIAQVCHDMSQLVAAIVAGEAQVNGFVVAEQETTAEILIMQLCNWCDDHLPDLQVAQMPGLSG